MVCLSFFIGCYSTDTATKEDLASKAALANISVYTKHSEEYDFSKGNYRVQGDSLTGYAIRRKNDSTEVVLRASLSFAAIDSIEMREFDMVRTIAFGGGIGLGVLILKTLLFK